MKLSELWDILDVNGNKTGRTIERGEPMADGDYHLCIYAWIMNNNGEFLIIKRTPNKSFPNMWECVCGNAVSGDDSLTTVLKEVKEETGITLESQNGQMIKHQLRKCPCNHCLADVWLFKQEINISDVVFCPDETCDVKWVSQSEINRMVDDGTFVTWDMFTRIEELFEFI